MENKKNYSGESLKLHGELKGKIETTLKKDVKNKEDLSLVYTPGVAEVCKEIAKDSEKAKTLTIKGDTIAIVSDGSAVLGLGNIGPEAALPVMEGKAMLFKKFGGVNAVPLCINTQNKEEIIDFIPSVFLGCPDTDTELSVLPGHELLKKGLGYEAIILTAYGSLIAIVILLIIAWPSILLISKSYSYIEKIIPWLLILVSTSLILLEKRKLSTLIVFLLTGTLGIIILNPNNFLGESINLSQPLLPLLTGLFGASNLILSIKNKIKIPKQIISKPEIQIFKPVLGAIIASPLCSFLPGMGSGQAAVIGNTISRLENKGFLILLGITNTLVMGFSFISLYIIEKTRTGAAVAIKEVFGTPTANILVLILIVVFISGIISFYLTIFLALF